MKHIREFFQLPGSSRRLFVEAFVLLGLTRLGTLVIPFRWLARWLGTQWAETSEATRPNGVRLAHAVAREIHRAARYTPWQSKCLPRALTARIMLRRRGLPSTLYLGVAKDGGSGLAAHAWLRYGNIILTGYEEMKLFTVVSTFAEEGPGFRFSEPKP